MEIVFFGNCQMRALFDLYNRYVTPHTADRTYFVANYNNIEANFRQILAKAEIVVEQILDFEARHSLPTGDLTAKIIKVPLISAGFLWPFAGQPHVHNETTWFMPDGPYSAEMGNSFLNRLISDSINPREATDRYINLDIPKAKNLDRLYELFMERQAARDRACEIDIAPFIERHFRDESLFRTPYHPNVAMARHLATQVFAKMNVDSRHIDKMARSLNITPFPKDENPIQFSICSHFKLNYVSDRTLYTFLEEGSFSIADMSMRYMRREWDHDLAEGLALIAVNRSTALNKLMGRIEATPDIASAHFAVGELLHLSGRTAESEMYYRRAVHLARHVDRFYHGLGGALLALGRHEEALQAADRAVASDSLNEHFRALRAHILTALRRFDEAEVDVRLALDIAPNDAHLNNLAGTIMRGKGLSAKAVKYIRSAYEMERTNFDIHRHLIEILLSVGEREEALGLATEAANGDRGDGVGWYILGKTERDVGDLDGAERNFRRALEFDPTNVLFLTELGHLLDRKNELIGSVECFQKCVLAGPSNHECYVKLFHALVKIGNYTLAEAEVRVAIALAPDRVDYLLHLAGVQVILGSNEALNTIGKIMLLDAGNIEAARLKRVLSERSPGGPEEVHTTASRGTGEDLTGVGDGSRTSISDNAPEKSTHRRSLYPPSFAPSLSDDEFREVAKDRTEMTRAELAMKFESFGDDCEFGFVQRRCGA